MTLEQQALLGAKNTRGNHYESLSGSSARMLDASASSSVRELDNTLSIQQPDGKPPVHVEFAEGLPIWRAALLVVNSALGAGILNFPQAYAECGGVATALTIQMLFADHEYCVTVFVTSLISLLYLPLDYNTPLTYKLKLYSHKCLLIFITGAFPILAYCAGKHKSQYFQDIIRELLGPTMYIATQILVVLYMFGSTITYMIVIGDQLEKVGEAISPHPHWYLSREFLMCTVCILLLLPLCLPKTLKVLSYSSLLGTVGALFVCAVVAVKYSEGTHTVSKEFIEVKLPWTKAFAALPIICFGFQCHVPSVAVYAELKRPSVPRFGIVVIIAMTICNIVYALTGSFGYLTFGTTVKSDVLLSYDSNDVLVNIARVMISVIVLSPGATVTFCGRTGLEGLYLTAFRMPPSLAEKNESTRRIVQTLVWFTLALLISVYVTDIQYAIALIGGLAALYIFFFPGIFLVQEMLQYSFLTTKRKLLIVLGLWYVVVGVFIFADSEVLAIMQDIKGKGLS